MYVNYYAVLGNIPKTASEKEIQQAYRALVKIYHPDKNPNNPGADAHMRQVNEAYQTLSDPVKRASYDQTLRVLEERARQAEFEKRKREKEAAARFAKQRTPTNGSNVGAFLGVAFGLAAISLLVAALADDEN